MVPAPKAQIYHYLTCSAAQGLGETPHPCDRDLTLQGTPGAIQLKRINELGQAL
jgi:hypothetical protein